MQFSLATRNSIFYSWITVTIAICGYLATRPIPTQWAYVDWLNAIIAIGGIILAKLGSSPLGGAGDPPAGSVNLSKTPLV